jgi:hypothetical protein
VLKGEWVGNLLSKFTSAGFSICSSELYHFLPRWFYLIIYVSPDSLNWSALRCSRCSNLGEVALFWLSSNSSYLNSVSSITDRSPPSPLMVLLSSFRRWLLLRGYGPNASRIDLLSSSGLKSLVKLTFSSTKKSLSVASVVILYFSDDLIVD